MNICIFVESICIKEEKSRLASHFYLIKCFHSQKRLTSRLVVQSLSMACWGIMVAYCIDKIDHGQGHDIWISHLLKMRKDEREKKKKADKIKTMKEQ